MTNQPQWAVTLAAQIHNDLFTHGNPCGTKAQAQASVDHNASIIAQSEDVKRLVDVAQIELTDAKSHNLSVKEKRLQAALAPFGGGR